MRLKVTKVSDGAETDQITVSIETFGGPEFLVVPAAMVDADWLEIGAPIVTRPGLHLIALPGETMSGACRVWVETAVLADSHLQAAE